jgi:hypothetical protein
VWSTPNGNILTNPPVGTSIVVDEPGTYIVTQYLNVACAPYAADTVFITFNDSTCLALPIKLLEFQGTLNNMNVQLNWKVLNNQLIQYFDLERSVDGLRFDFVNRIESTSSTDPVVSYYSSDQISGVSAENLFYRLKMTDVYGKISYSHAIRIALLSNDSRIITVTPNPVTNWAQVNINAAYNADVQIHLYNYIGSRVYSRKTFVQGGSNTILLDDLSKFGRGTYQLVVKIGSEIFFEKIIISK